MTAYAHTRRRPATAPVTFTAVHRLLLFAAAMVWFAAYVLAHSRNYQDGWILEGIWPAVLGLIAVYLLVVSREPDLRVVALLSAGLTGILAMVPALKYVQPYGVSIDASVHYLAAQTIYNTGHGLDPVETYATIPGMHSWLAALALAGGFSPAIAIKYGLPLMAMLYPPMVYWVGRRAELPAPILRYAVILSFLTAFPDYTPSGSGFSLQVLLLLLSVLLLREYYSAPGTSRVSYTVIALLLLIQLTTWHSTTPLLLPIALVAASLTPVVVKLLDRRAAGPARPNAAFLRFAALAGVVWLAYHVLLGDQIYSVIARTLYKLVMHQDTAATVVPPRLFQITALDIVRVALVIQGRDGVMIALLGLGALVVWLNRERWPNLLPFFVFWFLIAVLYLIMITAAVTGLDYDRFLIVPVAISPFFAGAAGWWLQSKLLAWQGGRLVFGRSLWAIGIVALVAIWMTEFYNFQPLIPKARALKPGTQGEYIVWVQAVNTAYQQRMLTFAEGATGPNTRFATDLTSQREFWRYFGFDAGIRRGLVLPLHWQVPLDDRIKFYLLHWPGPSGPLGEQVEDRSTAKISELRSTPNWSLVYDNGQSFILKIR